MKIFKYFLINCQVFLQLTVFYKELKKAFKMCVRVCSDERKQ